MTKIVPNDGTKPQLLTNHYVPQPPPKETAPNFSNHQTNQSSTDKAEISTRAHELASLRQAVDAGRSALAELPDVRAEKIAQARDRLAEGFYRSTEVREKVAGRLVNMFMDHPLF